MNKGFRDVLYDLVGRTFSIDIPQLTSTGTNLRKGKYLIIAAYPFHVMALRVCENEYVVRECFDIGTLIMNGILEQARVKEYYRHSTNGWGC